MLELSSFYKGKYLHSLHHSLSKTEQLFFFTIISGSKNTYLNGSLMMVFLALIDIVLRVV